MTAGTEAPRGLAVNAATNAGSTLVVESEAAVLVLTENSQMASNATIRIEITTDAFLNFVPPVNPAEGCAQFYR